MTVSLARRTTGAAPPVVLLHPLGADHRFWAPLLWELEHEAWTADLGGHGTSALPASAYTLEELADEVATAVADRIGSPVALVGSSYGGIVAQMVAARHPGAVSHLVLADTVDAYPEPMRAMWTERAAAVRAHGTRGVLDLTLDMWFSPEAVADDGDLSRSCRTMLLDTDPEAYALACEALRDADTTGVLGAVTARTVVVCGDEDRPAFVEAAPRLAAALSAGDVVWVDGARHAAVLERPEPAAAAIAALLGSVTA